MVLHLQSVPMLHCLYMCDIVAMYGQLIRVNIQLRPVFPMRLLPMLTVITVYTGIHTTRILAQEVIMYIITIK